MLGAIPVDQFSQSVHPPLTLGNQRPQTLNSYSLTEDRRKQKENLPLLLLQTYMPMHTKMSISTAMLIEIVIVSHTVFQRVLVKTPEKKN